MTCRYPSCPNEANRFCSDKCRVKYEHIKQDAKERERQEREEQYNYER